MKFVMIIIDLSICLQLYLEIPPPPPLSCLGFEQQSKFQSRSVDFLLYYLDLCSVSFWHNLNPTAGHVQATCRPRAGHVQGVLYFVCTNVVMDTKPEDLCNLNPNLALDHLLIRLQSYVLLSTPIEEEANPCHIDCDQ